MGESGKLREMNVNDLAASGVLQEVNRQFLHPLGLALGLEVLEFKALAAVTTKLGVGVDHEITKARLFIADHREDPEGIYFGWGLGDLDDALRKASSVARMRADKEQVRTTLLGCVIEPLPGEWGPA